MTPEELMAGVIAALQARWDRDFGVGGGRPAWLREEPGRDEARPPRAEAVEALWTDEGGEA